jgi:hypothetical protein
VHLIPSDVAPTLSGVAASASFIEGGAATALSPAVTVSDPDSTQMTSATVSIAGGTFAGDGDVLATTTIGNITASYNTSTETLTLSGTDTLAHYSQVLHAVTFASSSDNPTNFGSNATRTVTWTILDDFAVASAAQTTTVSLTGVNDAPTLNNVATSASFTEGGAAVTLSGAVSVADPDSLTLASATLAVTGGTFAGDGDVLSTSTTGTSITASYNSTTETLTLSGVDSFAHYQQVLDAVTFASSSDNPTNYGSSPARTVTWVLNDGGATSSLSVAQTTTVSLTNINDAPTLGNVATVASFTEGTPATLSPSATVSDLDNLTLAGATVAITGGTFAGSGDILSTSTAGTSITAGYSSATGTLTLSGVDTLAHYNQVLDAVTFSSGDNPTNLGSNPTRTVTWVVNDGAASSNLSTVRTTTVSLTAVNDAPTLSNVATVMSFVEHGATVTVSPSLTVSDPDSLTLVGATVAVTGGAYAGDGDVLAAVTTGTSITASYNSSTETLTLSGSDTLAHYQSVLDSVTFRSNPTHFGSGVNDYNHDGTSDIMFRNPITGDLGFYQIDNGSLAQRTLTWSLNDGSASNSQSTPATTSLSGWGAIGPASTAYDVVGIGDFNHDGTSDVLFRNATTGDVGFDQLTNGVLSGWHSFGGSSTAYNVVGVGDFNHDGTSDVLFRNNSSGDLGFYQISNGVNQGWVHLGGSSTGYDVVGVGDFNHDGTSDILFRNAANGDTGFYQISNGAVQAWVDLASTTNTAFTVAGVGDFNGDGTSDILFRNTTTGDLSIMRVQNGVNQGLVGVGTGPAGYAVVGTGDYNGDGTSDILFRNNTTGDTGFWAMSNGVNTGFHDIANSSTAYKVVG